MQTWCKVTVHVLWLVRAFCSCVCVILTVAFVDVTGNNYECVLCTCAVGGLGLPMSGLGANCNRCAFIKGAVLLLGTGSASLDNSGYEYY